MDSNSSVLYFVSEMYFIVTFIHPYLPFNLMKQQLHTYSQTPLRKIDISSKNPVSKLFFVFVHFCKTYEFHWMVILRLNTRLILNISDILRDLVSFVQFKNVKNIHR